MAPSELNPDPTLTVSLLSGTSRLRGKGFRILTFFLTILNPNSWNFISSGITPANYEEAYKKSIEDPESFWDQAAGNITWFKKYDKVFQTQVYPRTKWWGGIIWIRGHWPHPLQIYGMVSIRWWCSRFPGGELNVCYNALDRHIEDKRGGQVAIIYDSPVTSTLKKFTYTETLDRVRLNF